MGRVSLALNATQAAKSFALILSGFFAFIRRPTVETVGELSTREKITTCIWLFILSLAATVMFGILALPLILTTDLTSGEQLNEALSGSISSIILSVVLLGPFVEEIIFRGWLSGTWRAILASIFGLAVIYGGSAVLDPYFVENGVIKQLFVMVCAIAIFFAFSRIDSARRIIGFDRVFPAIFYTQAAVFGLLHFQNYAASSFMLALFATLPLVACGLIWGYARIRLGFASAVLLHTAYNIPAAFGSIILIHSATLVSPA